MDKKSNYKNFASDSQLNEQNHLYDPEVIFLCSPAKCNACFTYWSRGFIFAKHGYETFLIKT